MLAKSLCSDSRTLRRKLNGFLQVSQKCGCPFCTWPFQTKYLDTIKGWLKNSEASYWNGAHRFCSSGRITATSASEEYLLRTWRYRGGGTSVIFVSSELPLELSSKENTQISQAVASDFCLTECWACHQLPDSSHCYTMATPFNLTEKFIGNRRDNGGSCTS